MKLYTSNPHTQPVVARPLSLVSRTSMRHSCTTQMKIAWKNIVITKAQDVWAMQKADIAWDSIHMGTDNTSIVMKCGLKVYTRNQHAHTEISQPLSLSCVQE